jgi:hypothetical protein
MERLSALDRNWRGGFGRMLSHLGNAFGTKPLNDYVEGMGVERTLRDTAIALWAFLLPAWFIIEEAWFAPTDPTKQERFRRRQRNARMTSVAVAGAVSILIGASAPKTNPTTPPSVQTR